MCERESVWVCGCVPASRSPDCECSEGLSLAHPAQRPSPDQIGSLLLRKNYAIIALSVLLSSPPPPLPTATAAASPRDGPAFERIPTRKRTPRIFNHRSNPPYRPLPGLFPPWSHKVSEITPRLELTTTVAAAAAACNPACRSSLPSKEQIHHLTARRLGPSHPLPPSSRRLLPSARSTYPDYEPRAQFLLKPPASAPWASPPLDCGRVL
ncbi:hypothetical protein CC78DRAFT_577823 [Lojkania enalia]|uniref:Uncharacterized protein n=1 Tax=Lojkania enalia TaxID=147567 RepID=A0A9P4KCV3_9PLEO|nr:hypothetical protein CC78DRAFT_577823 [Didymosphaeria enalia]